MAHHGYRDSRILVSQKDTKADKHARILVIDDKADIGFIIKKRKR